MKKPIAVSPGHSPAQLPRLGLDGGSDKLNDLPKNHSAWDEAWGQDNLDCT